MPNREDIFYIDSQRDTHFTDALVSGASEYENFAYAQAGNFSVFLTSIRMTTATNHRFTVAVYSRDVHHQRLSATPYQGALIDYWEWASADAWATATEYVYSVTGLRIPVLDEDNTGELHIGLHNRANETKAALGAALPAGVPPQFIQMRFGLIAAL